MTTSRFQASGVDADPPAILGPVIARWTVGPPLYLAMPVRFSLQRWHVKVATTASNAENSHAALPPVQHLRHTARVVTLR